jgi:hypothetical protein
VTSSESAELLAAAPDYEHVSVDSRNALEIMKPGDTVIWDDYGAGWPGVVRAVDELARKFAIRRITGTSLAVLIPSSGPRPPAGSCARCRLQLLEGSRVKPGVVE